MSKGWIVRQLLIWQVVEEFKIGSRSTISQIPVKRLKLHTYIYVTLTLYCSEVRSAIQSDFYTTPKFTTSQTALTTIAFWPQLPYQFSLNYSIPLAELVQQ